MKRIIIGKETTLRATLITYSCDTLAAQEALGFLGPAAKHFCKICTISREEHLNFPSNIAPLRTEVLHEEHLLGNSVNQKAQTANGVKEEIILNYLK